MSRAHSDPTEPNASPLVLGALLLNFGLFLGAGVVYFASRSQLVLAQGADSLLDMASGVILMLSVWVGRQPSDENHPYGHDRAEPIGALVTAILAGVLAFEVLRSAAGSLIAGDEALMTASVAGILGGKLVLKGLILIWIVGARRRLKSSALSALWVDTRNDLVACASSLIGFGLARSGYPLADGLLALPVALYIGKSGFDLARENLRFLMGEAPDPEVMAELRTIGAAVSGVVTIGELRAQYAGPSLHVEVEIEVRAENSATEAHDISVEVQHSLEAHELVGKVFVHVDTVDGRTHP